MHPMNVIGRLFGDDAVPELDLRLTACPVCDSVDAQPVGVGYDFEYGTTSETFAALRCSDCNVVYLEQRPAPEELRVVYPDAYHAFEFEEENFGLAYRVRRRLETRRLRDWTRGLPPGARILDVGCGDGFHLELLRDLGGEGWRLEGVDVDGRAVAAARRRGLDVHQGALEDVDVEAASYDLILLIATIEHVYDPSDVLRRVRRLLVPGGRVGIVTDNTETPAFRWFANGYWGGYHFPRHFQLFDRRSLNRLAESAGLALDRVQTVTSPVNWTYSIRNVLVAHDAPSWLIDRFSLSSPVALAFFTLWDELLRWAGRGTLLRATYLRPSNDGVTGGSSVPLEEPSTSPPAPPAGRSAGSTGDALVLGAGFAGLVAARELQRRGVDATIFEAAPEVGGLARSFRDEDGFSYDFGAHFITNRLAAMLGVGSRCRVVHRYDESVLLDGKMVSYPFGLMRSPGFLASAIAARGAAMANGSRAGNAAEWFRSQYGSRLADRVAIPLLEAWSGAPATELASSVGDKLPDTRRSLWLNVASRLSGRAVGCGYSSSYPENWNVWHVYPREGVGSVMSDLAESLRGRIRLSSPVERIHVEDGRVRGVTSKGTFYPAGRVFSTAPVHILPRLVEGADLSRLERFRYRPMIFVNLMLEGRGLLPSTMVWTPEDRFPFFRLAEAVLSMPWLAPEGQTIVTADFGCETDEPLWKADDSTLVDLCVEHLSEIIPDVRDRYVKARTLRTRFAYPVYLKAYEEDRLAFRRTTGIEGLYSVGRNGRFSHDLMEDVYWTTRRAVNEAFDAVGSTAASRTGA